MADNILLQKNREKDGEILKLKEEIEKLKKEGGAVLEAKPDERIDQILIILGEMKQQLETILKNPVYVVNTGKPDPTETEPPNRTREIFDGGFAISEEGQK